MTRKRRHNWRATQLSYMVTDLAYNKRVRAMRVLHTYEMFSSRRVRNKNRRVSQNEESRIIFPASSAYLTISCS